MGPAKLPPMRSKAALLLILSMALASPCMGQWMWRDAQGKRVYSDRPPPSDIPDRDVVQRPAASRAAAAPASVPSAPSVPASGQDKELEQRRQQAEAAEAARQKAAQAEQAKGRAENCTRARQARASFDSGVRIARLNAQGEREIMDDAARDAETRRLQQIIARDCGPAAQ